MTNEPEKSPAIESFVSIAKLLESLGFAPDIENGGWWWKHQQNIIVVRFLDTPPHVLAIWLNTTEKLHDQCYYDFDPASETDRMKLTRDVLKFVVHYQGRSEPTGLKFPESQAA